MTCVSCQLLLKLNVAVSSPKAKATLVTVRILLFHRLWSIVMLIVRP